MELLTFFTSFLALTTGALAIGQPASLAFTETADGLKLGGTGSAPTIIIDGKDWPGVTRAGNDLANDFGLVTGTKGTVAANVSATTGPVIIAGTVGHSPLIDGLVSSGKLDVSAIQGQWESFSSQVVANPVAGVDSALVLAGSDKRGTIYALYDISEQIGVSPWYWWADVPPKKKTAIYALNSKKTQGPPSIKYRGVFINDEQPALTNWVKEKYDGVYDSRFHAKVFELLLRLRANYFWPAMWNSIFFTDDPKNSPMADEMGIVIGTSHTEPMARADKEKVKPWDWVNNQANVENYMEYGANRSKNYEVVWTLGMRGDGDTASPTLTASSLEDVIQFQQSTLENTLGMSNITTVPQMWCIYKEVGGYYQTGMKVPDDITILWTDDNVGNIERLPIANETNRVGNAGVYYHFDYVGSPRNYKWINSIQLSKTWEQMYLAHEKNARQIWIVNVGDLKAQELPISHFLDMAYDITQFKTPASTDTWLQAWATREFGSSVAAGTAEAMATYGRLMVRRKYELLNSQPFIYSTVNYDEAESVLNEWIALQAKAQAMYDSLDPDTQTSFFEMVLHPITAGGIVQRVYINAARNQAYAAQKRMSANVLADDVKQTYAQHAVMQKRYHSLLDGKWDHIMDQVVFGYTSWQDPTDNTMPTVTNIPTTAPYTGLLGVAVQGSTSTAPESSLSLLPLDPFTPENRTLELFIRGTGTVSFNISASAPYITIDPATCTLTYPSTSGVNSTDSTQTRAVISVDWSKAPAGSSTATLTVNPSSGSAIKVSLPLNNNALPAAGKFAGYVESNGALAIEVARFSASSPGSGGAALQVIPNYGRTDSGLTMLPVTAGSQALGSAPKVEYSFYSFTEAASANVSVYLAPSFNVDPGAPLKYAIAVDDGAPVVVAPVQNTTLGNMPQDWNDAVTSGARMVVTPVGKVGKGAHTLNLWVLEPGTVVQRLVVNLGGVRASYLGGPEGLRVGT